MDSTKKVIKKYENEKENIKGKQMNEYIPPISFTIAHSRDQTKQSFIMMFPFKASLRITTSTLIAHKLPCPTGGLALTVDALQWSFNAKKNK